MRFSICKTLPLKTIIAGAALLINSFGLAITAKNAMGGDAMNTFFNAAGTTFGLSSGTMYTVFNGTFLLIGIFLARKNMGVGSVIHLFIFGFLLDKWSLLLGRVEWMFHVDLLKMILAAVGITCNCFGNGMFISCRLGIPGFEAILFRLSDVWGISYRAIKIGADALFFAGALLLHGVYGIMTIVFVCCAGPLISFFVVNINQTLLHWLGISDRRNELNGHIKTD